MMSVLPHSADVEDAIRVGGLAEVKVQRIKVNAFHKTPNVNSCSVSIQHDASGAGGWVGVRGGYDICGTGAHVPVA